MSNALMLFDNPKMSVPAHIASFFEEESNIADKVTVPSLSYEGKVWTISLNGEKTKLTKRNDEGDEEPIQTMKVVVLDYAKRRGRAYYEGAYDPAKPGTPLCWSEDGEKPDPSVSNPQAPTCKQCPMSVKGSKVTEQGKAVTACSQHRMIVVVPANKLDFTPLRCKIAITSDYDKQSPELEAKGWFAFSQYIDLLRSRGVHHTAALVTKIKFDPNVAYPKLIFSPERWLTDDEINIVAPIAKSEEVKKLLSGTWTPAGVDGVPIAADMEDDDDIPFETPASAAKPEPEPAPAPKRPGRPPKQKPTLVEDDEDEVEVEVIPASTPAKAANDAPAKAADIPDDVASLLEEWGD